MLIVCFESRSRTLEVVRASRRFAVNILRAEDAELAAVFASKRVGREKFEAVTHTEEHGVPVLDRALAWVACDLRELRPGGDHEIGIGEVLGTGAGRRRAAGIASRRYTSSPRLTMQRRRPTAADGGALCAITGELRPGYERPLHAPGSDGGPLCRFTERGERAASRSRRHRQRGPSRDRLRPREPRLRARRGR